MEFSGLQDPELLLLSDPMSATPPGTAIEPILTTNHTLLATMSIPFITAHSHLPLIALL